MTPFLFDFKNKVMTLKHPFIGYTAVIGLIIAVQVLSLAFRSYFAAPWIICYIIGYFLPVIISKKKITFYLILSIIPLCIILNTVRYFYKYVYSDIALSSLKVMLLDIISSYGSVSLGLVLFLLIFYSTSKYTFGPKISVFLDLADKYSYDIFLVHMIYIKGVLSVIGLTQNKIIDALLAITLSIVSGTILHIICHTIIPKIIVISNIERFV